MDAESKFEDTGSHCSRRQFIKNAASAGAAVLGGGLFTTGARARIPRKLPRERIPNPFVNAQGKPILVSVEGNDFATMLEAGLQALGGWNPLLNDDPDVLIKPNCNSIDSYPAVTSGASILALIESLRAATSGGISVGDMGYHPTGQVYQSSGIGDAVGQTDAELLHFSVPDTYNVRHPDWDEIKPNYLVFQPVYDAPILVNFPCLKRHFLGMMSCGMKNHVGTIPGENASASRGTLHGYAGTAFMEEIAEIASLLDPDITIVDARSVLAGNGPLPTQAGAYIVDDVGRMILGGDVVSVDLYCADLLESLDPGFSASMIAPTVARAQERGLGVGSLRDVEVVEISTTEVEGEDVASPEGFVLSQNFPNPFNPETRIRFALEEKAHVRLDVFDLTGRNVATLLDGVKPRGAHTVRFDAGNLPSGRYGYRLRVGESTLSKTMLLAR